jgi:hypothetical protein
MKYKFPILGVLIIGSVLVFQSLPIRAQKTPKTLTILYSNNINGETDPCPT